MFKIQMINPSTKTRVVVAMSGGVDSSVAALLLKQQGFDVVGISLKVWDGASAGRGKTCCSFQDIEDARAVCDGLGIPFYAFNYKKDFEEKVIHPFVSEYYEGRTPNPCILCNRYIKFNRLLNEATQLGASYLATGHHARVTRDGTGRMHLLKGRDESKDQSYVLYSLTETQLQKVLLPVGEYTKLEIRNLASAHGLKTADKLESQDICFVPNHDPAAFIEKNYPSPEIKKGHFVDKDGKILGEHRGIHAYTVGQRRGLGIGFGERMYVIKIDVKKNEVELGSKEEILADGLVAKQVNWIQKPPMDSIECGVKIRYQKTEIPSVISCLESHEQAVVQFTSKYPAVSPGQAAVFYRGNEVLGGGMIEKSL